MNRLSGIPHKGMRRPATMLCTVLCTLMLSAPAAEARPNLTAKFTTNISAVRPLPPNRWCTVYVEVENRGDQSFSNNFLVKVRAKNGTYFWNNVGGWVGDRGGDCGPVSNGVDCWLKPIAAGRSKGFHFDLYPRYSGPEALIIYVDTTNAVAESYEANTFVTAAYVRGSTCPR